MSGADYHSERPQDILAALVTSKVLKYRGVTDYALQDWAAAGLHQASVVRATLATVEQGQISAHIGHLTERDLAGVDAALRRALDLPGAGPG